HPAQVDLFLDRKQLDQPQPDERPVQLDQGPGRRPAPEYPPAERLLQRPELEFDPHRSRYSRRATAGDSRFGSSTLVTNVTRAFPTVTSSRRRPTGGWHRWAAFVGHR